MLIEASKTGVERSLAITHPKPKRRILPFVMDAGQEQDEEE
jgi:hypothetical protein